jgi:hypothetical protein
MAVSALLITGPRHQWWQTGVAALALAIATSLAPILFSLLNFGEVNDPGDWFDNGTQLGHEKVRVEAHYSRMRGTLGFWKYKLRHIIDYI